MGEIGVLKGPKKKCRIIRVVGLTVVGLTVLHCISFKKTKTQVFNDERMAEKASLFKIEG